MPLGNPIRKQNESRIVSVLATEGQTVFTVQGGYIINHISVFRNGVRLSNSEDFTAGDGSTVTLNNAANIEDRIEFHVFDRFTVQNAIVGAASTQTIQGDLVINGKIFGNLDVPSVNTGIVTATNLNITGISTFGNVDFSNLNVSGITTTGSLISNGAVGIGTTGARGATVEIQDIGGTGPCLLLAGATGTEGDIVVPDGQEISLGHWNNVDTFTERFRIDSSGKVGLGTNNPTGSLSIASGAFQTTTPTATGDDIVISGDQSLGIQFLTLAANTSNNNIYFGDTADPDVGMIRYSHSSNSLQFQTNTAEAMRIDSAGEVGIGTNNPESVLDVRNYKNGAQTKIMLYNTDHENTTTQTAGMFMSPDSRGFAYAGLSVKKENADFSTNAGRDISLILNVSENNTQKEVIHITSAGLVGIGTNNPSRKLDLHESSSSGNFISITNDTTGHSATDGALIGLQDDESLLISNKENNHIEFHTNNDEKLRIRSWGDVNLTQNLNVAGISTFTGLGDFNNGINVLSDVTISDSIVHDSDTDTKIRFPAADTITAETAGEERLRINADGRLLIGSSAVRNLGGSNSSGYFQLEGTSANSSSISVINNQNSNQSPILRFGKSRGTSVGAATSVANSDRLGAIRFAGADGTDLENDTAAITVLVNGDVSGNSIPTDITFETSPGSGGNRQERLRIKSSGGVGIGTTAARGATLEIQDIGTTGPTLLLAGGTTTEGDIVVPDAQQISLGHWNNVDTFTERFLIQSNGVKVIKNGNLNISSTYIDFSGSISTPSTAAAIYRPADNTLAFSTANTERIRISSGGHLQIISGNLEFAAGSGIDFSANAASSVSGTTVSTDGNKFDDYEEGDWQPVLKFGGSNTGLSYAARDGAYTKVGRQVTINFMVELSSKGSSTGDATITGLPYSVSDIISNTIIEASGSASYWNNIDPDLMWLGYSAESTGSGQLSMRFQPEGGASDAVDSLSNTQFTNTTNFRGTITYFTST